MFYNWYYNIDTTDIEFAKETIKLFENKLEYLKKLKESDDINNKIKRVTFNINCIKYTYSL
jgi:hypothetical protein|tara:strand:+ start:312 stop:494 length:183 start_codon:yes stop_codon:yes gene_type:complete